MTDLTWPSGIVPASSSWSLISNTAAFTSPLSSTTRTLSRGGDRWGCSVTTPPLTAANRAVMRAFVAALRGQTNRVVLYDHSYVKRGTQSAAVAVNGGSQTGESLVVDGGTPSATLLAGDYIGVGGYLHMVVTDATFNASGQATLAITPPLRRSPADNATVTISNPTARFMLTGNSAGWSNQAGGISTFTLEFIEDLTPATSTSALLWNDSTSILWNDGQPIILNG